MTLLNDISPMTILMSAGISVVTGYVGTLLNFRRQRDRTYGLAILPEIKTLERVFRHYHGVLGSESAKLRASRPPKLRLTNADLNIFGFNVGQIGLFSIRTAVEVIEFYSRVRALIAQSETLKAQAKETQPDSHLADEIYDHLRAVVLVRQQSHTVARLLHKELPRLPEDWLKHLRRRAQVAWRRRGLRRRPRAQTGRER